MIVAESRGLPADVARDLILPPAQAYRLSRKIPRLGPSDSKAAALGKGCATRLGRVFRKAHPHSSILLAKHFASDMKASVVAQDRSSMVTQNCLTHRDLWIGSLGASLSKDLKVCPPRQPACVTLATLAFRLLALLRLFERRSSWQGRTSGLEQRALRYAR